MDGIQLTGSRTTGSAAIDTGTDFGGLKHKVAADPRSGAGTSLIGAPAAALETIFDNFPGSVRGEGSFEDYWLFVRVPHLVETASKA